MREKFRNFLILSVLLTLSVYLAYGYIIPSTVTLHYPTNGSIVDNVGGVIDFNCSAVSNSTAAMNMTIWTNLSETFAPNDTWFAGDAANDTIINFSHAFAGDYHVIWNCRVNDSESAIQNFTFAIANYTITIDTLSPSNFSLGNFTVNASNSTDNTPTLNWTTSSDLTFVNYTVFIFNNATMNSTTLETSVLVSNAKTSDTTLSALDDGTYYWYVTAYDNKGHATNSSTNLSVGGANTEGSVPWHVFSIDATAPTIDSVHVINYTVDRLNYTFSFNVSEGGVCTLFGNWSGLWAANETLTVVPNTLYNFTAINFTSLAGFSYSWGINCSDAVGNESNTGWSNNYTFTTQDRIVPKVPTNISLSVFTSSNPDIAELRWPKVTLDVEENDDEKDLQYMIWRSTVAPVNISAGANASEGFVNIKNVSFVSNSTTDQIGTSGTYYYLVTTVDDQGNVNFSMLNDTVGGINFGSIALSKPTASTGSGSGGTSSGGSGGGAAVTGATTTTSSIKKTQVFGFLNPSEPSVMNLVGEQYVIKRLEIYVKEKLDSAGLTFVQLNEKPAETTELGGAYKYFELMSENLPLSALDKVAIHFEVDKAWLLDGNFDQNSVLMKKFREGEWHEIPTELVKDQGTSYLYKAETGTFSYYAISVEAKEKAPTTVEKVVEKVKEVTPESFAWGWLVLTIAIIAGLIWYFMKKE